MEKIKRVGDVFIVSIHESKQSKCTMIKIPFEGTPKRVEIEKASIPKTGELVLV